MSDAAAMHSGHSGSMQGSGERGRWSLRTSRVTSSREGALAVGTRESEPRSARHVPMGLAALRHKHGMAPDQRLTGGPPTANRRSSGGSGVSQQVQSGEAPNLARPRGVGEAMT